jgi:hypothetical protein
VSACVLGRLLLASALVGGCGGGSSPSHGGPNRGGGRSDLVDDRMPASSADGAGTRIDADGPDASPPDAPAGDAHDAPVDVTVAVRDASEGASDTSGGQDAAEAGTCVPRRCGHEIACGVAADGCGDSVTCDPCPDVGRALRLAGARHMVVDKARGLIYVTMPASHPTYPNTVLVVAPTPTTPKVMSSVQVGAEPNVIALSDDGSRLWVGTDGDSAIRKIELGSGAPVMGPQYKLPFGSNYPYPTRAGALKVLHGNGDSVIVSLASTTAEIVGIVVIDDGVPRTGAMRANASCLTVGRNNDVFGADGRTTAYDFFDLQVGAQGVTPVLFPKLLTDFSRDLVFEHDRVYSEGGDVVDVSNPSAPVHVGKLPTWGSPRPLPGDATRVLLLAGGPLNGDAILRMVDASTFAAKATVSIAGVTGYFMRDMDLLGSDSIAFIAEELTPNDAPNRLVVARTSLLP